jgi:hypothetical protein
MTNVFLDHGACQPVPRATMLEEVAYELHQRDRVYPRLAKLGRVSQAELERHDGAMVSVLRFLQRWGQLELFAEEGQHARQTIHNPIP